jgi:hypothetical protein
MNSREYIASYPAKVERLAERLSVACAKLSDEQFNAVPPNWHWSPAQIIQHMLITNRGYIPVVEQAIEDGIEGNGQLKHTWLAKILLKMTGPGGNAKAPKFLHPTKKPYTREIIDEWTDQHREIAKLARDANGIDLSRTKFRNPYFKAFRMNLYDAFEAVRLHAERHVGQIESIAAKVS